MSFLANAERGKKLLYFYQRANWYLNLAVGEAKKPLTLLNETILVATYLTVNGKSPALSLIILSYLAIMVIGAIMGKVIQKTGIVKYTTQLSNNENEQFQEILQRLENIEKKVDASRTPPKV